MVKIQLSHYEFDLSDRYRAGMVLTDAEAKALNVTRSERIRNKVARHLDRKCPDKEVLTGDERAELYAWVKSLDESFQFTERNTNKSRLGTLEAEMREVAQEQAESMARERGRGADAELVKELFEGLLDDPRIEEAAAARIEARRAVAANGLGEL